MEMRMRQALRAAHMPHGFPLDTEGAREATLAERRREAALDGQGLVLAAEAELLPSGWWLVPALPLGIAGWAGIGWLLFGG